MLIWPRSGGNRSPFQHSLRRASTFYRTPLESTVRLPRRRFKAPTSAKVTTFKPQKKTATSSSQKTTKRRLRVVKIMDSKIIFRGSHGEQFVEFVSGEVSGSGSSFSVLEKWARRGRGIPDSPSAPLRERGEHGRLDRERHSRRRTSSIPKPRLTPARPRRSCPLETPLRG